MIPKKKFLNSIDPFFLTSGITMCLLGALMAVQAGRPFNLLVFLQGLTMFFCIYFFERISLYLTSSSVSPYTQLHSSEKLRSRAILGSIFVLFGVFTFSLYGLVYNRHLLGSGWIWTILMIAAIFSNLIRNFRIWGIAYRWLIEGFTVTPILLFFSNSIQSSNPGKILFFLSVPLLFLYLGSSIALQFEKYPEDLEKNTISFLRVVGWEKSIDIHNLLVLIAYIFLGIYLLISGAWITSWPVMLISGISLFEMLQLKKISEGMKPNWGILRGTAVTQFLGAVYMLIFAFFTN